MNLTTYMNNRPVDPFKPKAHSGLNFYYDKGVVRADNVVEPVVAGSVALKDDAVNYIEVAMDGTVSSNTTDYTSGSVPLYKVTTASGVITEVQDDRCFFNVAAGGGGDIFEDSGYNDAQGVTSVDPFTYVDSGIAEF